MEMVIMEEDMDDASQATSNLNSKPKPNKSSPHELLQRTKTSIEEIISKMLSIKQQAQPKTQLSELVTQMFLNLVSLRQANRNILLEEERGKAEMELAKAPIDYNESQLRNLMYEKSQYAKAIRACKDFKSKYPDIEMVDEEEFFRDASEEIKGSITPCDSARNMMLKRLNYELFQRKALCKHQVRLQKSKKRLVETISNRKKFFSSLPSHLKSLKKASLPVQNQLRNMHSKKLKKDHSAELLPPPLYVIYSQFLAQKEAFGEELGLEIVGSPTDAQAYALQHANENTGNLPCVGSSKFEGDAPKEEEDGQRMRKRSKKVLAINLDKAGIYQAFPLNIILHIYDDEVSVPRFSKLITLKFEYMPKLNVVCVGIEGLYKGSENNILCNLFPDDTGLELPSQSAKLFVDDAFGSDVLKTSRPYKWAQNLAGITFLPEVSPLLTDSVDLSSETTKSVAPSSGHRVETIVQRIRSQKKAQLALA